MHARWVNSEMPLPLSLVSPAHSPHVRRRLSTLLRVHLARLLLAAGPPPLPAPEADAAVLEAAVDDVQSRHSLCCAILHSMHAEHDARLARTLLREVIVAAPWLTALQVR